MSPVHVALLVISLHLQDSPQPKSDCREWHQCRQLALDAAERKDYETFHDLAWRAVQSGPKNDPGLMYLLARAQSLSGRPGDALVMLQRLVQMGTKTDAATNDDFRRVRALPGWAELERSGGATSVASPAPPTAPSSPPDAIESGRPRNPRDENRLTSPVTAASPSNAGAKPVEPRGTPSPAAFVESLRFTTAASTPAGLAYDAVSRRFIVGDREARKLTVVDEFSQHVANLASAQSAGFGNIAALEIDPRQGNLWVVSTDAPAPSDAAPRADAAPSRPTLHKLQLVSGRVLQTFVPPDRAGAARFVDVATTSDSTVLVLDDSGHRIFRLRPKATDLEVAAKLTERPSSIAPAAEGIAYVASEQGISVVDLTSRSVTPLKASSGVDLSHVSRLRWHKGSLVGIQQNEGSYRAVRFALDPTGRRAIRQQILDASLPTTGPTAATIAGGVLYYLASGDGAEMIIRKITLP
jgi:hypothetical protein